MLWLKEWFLSPLFCLLIFQLPAQADMSVKTRQVGDFSVSVLTERQVDAKADDILINISDEDKKSLAPGGTYAAAYNAFLIKQDGKNVLVDTGFGTKLFENLESLNVKPENIDVILLTHMHGDHIGGMLNKEGAVNFPNAQLYVAKREYEYWKEKESTKKILDAYKDKLILFEPEEIGDVKDLLPGIQAWKAYGHTPGHTVFLVQSKGNKLLIIADVVHAIAVQAAVPEVGVKYDVDPAMAAKTRKEIFSYVVDKKIPIAGMHIPYPGMGELLPVKDRAYKFNAMKSQELNLQLIHLD